MGTASSYLASILGIGVLSQSTSRSILMRLFAAIVHLETAWLLRLLLPPCLSDENVFFAVKCYLKTIYPNVLFAIQEEDRFDKHLILVCIIIFFCTVELILCYVLFHHLLYIRVLHCKAINIIKHCSCHLQNSQSQAKRILIFSAFPLHSFSLWHLVNFYFTIVLLQFH